jgi:glutathione S-transferase
MAILCCTPISVYERAVRRHGEISRLIVDYASGSKARVPPRVARMKLYFSPLSCSLAPRVVATEAGVDLDFILVDFYTKLLPDTGEDYRHQAPLGLVPMLRLDDGTKLTEVTAIVQYLADRNPAARLTPPWESRQRYELYEWLSFTATELHKKVLWPIFNRPASRESKEFARDAAPAVFDHLERRLAGRSYLLGETFSVADAYAAWAMYLCPFAKLDLGERPALRAYTERVSSRPSVRDAIALELPLAVAARERSKTGTRIAAEQ